MHARQVVVAAISSVSTMRISWKKRATLGRTSTMRDEVTKRSAALIRPTQSGTDLMLMSISDAVDKFVFALI
jgi:hypothetical protein